MAAIAFALGLGLARCQGLGSAGEVAVPIDPDRGTPQAPGVWDPPAEGFEI